MPASGSAGNAGAAVESHVQDDQSASGVEVSQSTKLYQKPGSPLIQGHSKTERGFWGEWLRGFLAATLVGYAVFVIWELSPDAAFGGADLVEAGRAIIVLFVPGAVFGCALGVPLARGFGWRRSWQAAAALGLLAGGLSTWLLRLFAASLLGL